MEEVKKVLILGSTGMLGHQVTLLLSGKKDYEVSNLSFRKKLNSHTIICDIVNKNTTIKVINDINPDIIVNCVGVLIKGANDNPANAIYINSYFPHFLRLVAEKCNAKVIHISTDCVFSGKKGRYTLKDVKDGMDIYAQSKSLGEIISDKHLTLRTSIVGPELKENGEGLFHWFMKSDGVVNGYTKAIWSGVTTMELAKVIDVSIRNNLTGIFQITNNDTITKYELLKLFKEYFPDKTPNVLPIPGKAVDKSLISEKIAQFHQIPSYKVMIREMKEQMEIMDALYKQYF